MAYKKQLQVRYIDEEIYYKMLSRMPVVDVDNFKDYTYGIVGYNKQTTAVRCKDDPKQFICLKLFEEVCYPKKYWTPEGSWKQIRYILDNDKAETLLPYKEVQEQEAKKDKVITGKYAFSYVMKIIRKYYTDAEIDDIFKQHSNAYNKKIAQQHYLIDYGDNDILKFENCVYYDINGAHADALRELFPKCEADFLYLYNMRKTNPEYKSILNYAVGYLCRVDRRETYNWIVQRTTNKLIPFIKNAVGGRLIYANTDGFIVQNPENEPDNSMILGEFKKEYRGDVYVYHSNNPGYTIMQYGDKKKGTLWNSLRERVDLRCRRVVTFHKLYDENTKTYHPENVKEIII